MDILKRDKVIYFASINVSKYCVELYKNVSLAKILSEC